MDNLKIQTGVDSSEYTTLGIGGIVNRFITLTSLGQIPELLKIKFNLKDGQRMVVLGGGSNCVFPDSMNGYVVVKNDIKGITASGGKLTIGAGENWDDVCAYAAEHELQGVEALSGIPGSVGGAVVQNIGAYGSEIKDVFISAWVLDFKTEEVKEVDANWMEFHYRSSRIKSDTSGRYLVLGVALQLDLNVKVPVPGYAGVADYIKEYYCDEVVSVEKVRNTILAIRAIKLPDWKKIPNAGSFFKNPIVEKSVAAGLQLKYPQVPVYSADGKSKLSAGWLLDNLDHKGRRFGGLQVYSNHALVITNPDRQATYGDLVEYINITQAEIQENYGVTINPEPVIYEEISSQ